MSFIIIIIIIIVVVVVIVVVVDYVCKCGTGEILLG